jgi:hypothetical protein
MIGFTERFERHQSAGDKDAFLAMTDAAARAELANQRLQARRTMQELPLPAREFVRHRSAQAR